MWRIGENETPASHIVNTIIYIVIVMSSRSMVTMSSERKIYIATMREPCVYVVIIASYVHDTSSTLIKYNYCLFTYTYKIN